MYRLIRIPALLLALAVSCLLSQPAFAENNFEIPNVHVEASGPSAAEARSIAIAGGRSVAWSMLVRRLTRQQDWPRQPVLHGATLQKVIIGYLPLRERRSTTRYVADVTYTFNPDAVAQTPVFKFEFAQEPRQAIGMGCSGRRVCLGGDAAAAAAAANAAAEAT